jgi:hypothetical protein
MRACSCLGGPKHHNSQQEPSIVHRSRPTSREHVLRRIGRLPSGIREVVIKGESGDRLLEAIEKHLDKGAKSLSVLPGEIEIVDVAKKEEPPAVV